MLSDKLDDIKPGESLDNFKADAEKLLHTKVETLKQQLIDSKQYASDEIDKMIEDADSAKEKAIKTLHSKLDQGIDLIIDNKKEILGELQKTTDHLERIHHGVDFNDPKSILETLKMQKVELLNKAQSSATTFLKDKYQGLVDNSTLDNTEPENTTSTVSSGLGSTFNMAGGFLMRLLSDNVVSKVMKKTFYKQIEDKHGKKEVLIQELLSGSMTPASIDKEFRKRHDEIINHTKMSPQRKEQELLKLRLEYEDQARPAIARSLHLMGEKDESGEKIKNPIKRVWEFMKRASDDEFDYASFYLVASHEDEDVELPFHMQIKLDLVKTQYLKEMKKHTEDLFSGKKNKELFEYMTGKKSIPREYYDQVKKNHIEKAHQISDDYKKKKKSKPK